MRLVVGRSALYIVAENNADEAYFDHVLGCANPPVLEGLRIKREWQECWRPTDDLHSRLVITKAPISNSS